LQKWIQATRPFSLTASLVPILVGGALAFRAGRFDLVNFVIVLVGGVLLQIGTNMVNDAYDVHFGVDAPDAHRPGHAVYDVGMDPALEARVGVGVFVVAIALGGVLALRVGPLILVPVVLGALGGYFYTAPPVHYKYRGWSVPIVFWMMGPIMIWAAAYGTGGTMSAAFWWVSIPVGLLVASILHANDIRDIEGDRTGRIVTLAGSIGERMSLGMYGGLIFVPYALAVVAVASGRLPWTALFVLATLPLAERAWARAKAQILPTLDAQTAQIHLTFGLLLAVGLFASAAAL